MALTVNIIRQTKFMHSRVTIAEIVMDNSYTTGGKSLTAAQLGLEVIDLILPTFNSGYDADYDYANRKLLAYKGDGTEVTAATNMSTVKFRIMASGL